jgi:hypothetical protein
MVLLEEACADSEAVTADRDVVLDFRRQDERRHR